MRRDTEQKHPLSQWCLVWLAIIAASHVILSQYVASRVSPTFNEIGHLPAGISHWEHGRFELYRVNPPLPRMVAAFPVLWSSSKVDWMAFGFNDLSRGEIRQGIRYCNVNGSEAIRFFRIGRWSGVIFSLIGLGVCFVWSRRLYGTAAGLVACAVWGMNPMLIGHSALIMPDVPAAAMGLAASYVFWRWLKNPCWSQAALTGVLFGLAQLCKTTHLVLFIVWPLLWCLTNLIKSPKRELVPRRTQLLQLATIGILGIYVINVGYGFHRSLKPLGEFQFLSQMLTGAPVSDDQSGNRFADSWLRTLPVPLPADYLQGIDRQKADFELGERSYLRGEWKQGGWWYYHLYGLGIKTPLGTLFLMILACILVFLPTYRAEWRDELCLIAPAVSILVLVSSQTGFSNHVRYTIPAWPFLFIWLSRCGKAFDLGHRWLQCTVVALVIWTASSCLAVYPYCISYFNEFVGGAKGGHRHLLDSNMAWGQDLLNLRDWLNKHPQARPLRLASFGWFDPRLLGIEFSLPPLGPSEPQQDTDEKGEFGPQPGWYAIDVNFLHATHWPAATGKGFWREIPTEGKNYEYFLLFEPVATAGNSIYIYHITVDDANQVRMQLGMSPISD